MSELNPSEKQSVFTSRNLKAVYLCLGVTCLTLFLYCVNAFDAIERKSIDARFQLRGGRPADPAIAVVTIDEESIEKLGRWPWPRGFHGKLTRVLVEGGAKAVAFDSIFSERDKSSRASDAEFAAAARDTGKVAVAMHFRGDIENHLNGVDPLFPYEPLNEHAYKGFVNFEPDQDGVSRHAYLYAVNGEHVYPSLSVAAFALAQDKSVEDILKDLPRRNGRPSNDLFINYAFEWDRYPYKTYSYADVLDGKIPKNEFLGKTIFVGATAAALGDVKVIPFVSKYPGVMIHANVLDNLYSRNPMKEVSSTITSVYILVLGVLFGFITLRLSPWAKLAAFLAVTFVNVGGAYWLFKTQNMVVPMVAPLFQSIACYGGLLFYRLIIEEREKRKIKGSFRQYLSPKIIDIITKDPSKLRLGGEEREVSIFFLDIAGFTTMSEALTPTQLVEVMNECLNGFSDVILKHDGLINKYIGDCIMAFWNAPADQPHHAAQACRAALECIEILPAINKSFRERGLPNIDCRIGINTGTVVVGNMGSKGKFDYTVMGDAVNLASRMEGANKQYHSHIMISDSTFEKAKDAIEARDLDLIRVKGKREPRKVFEVLCEKGKMTDAITEGRKRYHHGLSLYRKQNFEEAVEAFQEVFDYLPNDHVTRVYLERARAFINRRPPAEWDGVYEMTTK